MRSAFWSLGLIWQQASSSLIASIACTLLQGFVPAAYALAIRGLINGATAATAGGGAAIEPFWFWLAAAFAVSLIDALAASLQQLASERLRLDLSLHANERVMRHAAKLDLAYFEHAANRETIEQVQRDPGRRLHQFFVETQRALLALIQIVGLLGVLVWLEPLLLLIMPVLAMPLLLFQLRFSENRFRLEQSRGLKLRAGRYFLRKLTTPHTVGEIQALGIGSLLAERFTKIVRELRDEDLLLQKQQVLAAILFASAATVAFYLVFAHVAHQVVSGVHSVGDLAVFGGAVARLRSSLAGGVRAAALAREQNLYNGVLRGFLAAQPGVVDRAGPAARSESLDGRIEVRNLSFTYPGTAEPALRDVSFEIAPGETVAIVGENGSGKSTLTKLLARLYDASRGTILLDGELIERLPLATVRREISLLMQDFGRYEASAAENIAFGDWDRLRRDRAEVEEVADRTGVAAMVGHLPAGLDTPLGRELGAYDLSGGQWQRLAIARALAHGGAVLILDEPSSNIDAQAEHDLLAAVAAVSRARTTIIVSHRFSTLRLADRILVMHRGTLAEEGTHDSLIAADGHYARLYRLHETYRMPRDG